MQLAARTHTINLADLLESLQRLGKTISVARAPCVRVVGEIARHNALAATQNLRRAEKAGSRDNRIMLAGYPAEIKQALDVCDVALAGAHHCGAIFIKWQVEAALALVNREPNASLDFYGLLREILRDDDKRAYLTDLGAYVRWIHLSGKYWADHAEFESSAFGTDPEARWRRLRPTANQRYMISRLMPLIAANHPGFVMPELATAGAAHDFIRDAGGNPRFQQPPTPPSNLGPTFDGDRS